MPAASRTSKVTIDDSVKPEPLRKICSGEACTKARLAAAGASIGRVSALEVAVPSTTTCNWSALCTAPQPLSRYCSVTELLVAETLVGDSVALPCATHAELMLRLTGEVTPAPPRLMVSAVWA